MVYFLYFYFQLNFEQNLLTLGKAGVERGVHLILLRMSLVIFLYADVYTFFPQSGQ